jgi:hypothetical protein
MFRWTMWVAWMVAAATAVAACGDGYSTSEATAECDAIKGTHGANCINDASYARCVECFETCGQFCGVAVASPCAFSCPNE